MLRCRSPNVDQVYGAATEQHSIPHTRVEIMQVASAQKYNESREPDRTCIHLPSIAPSYESAPSVVSAGIYQNISHVVPPHLAPFCYAASGACVPSPLAFLEFLLPLGRPRGRLLPGCPSAESSAPRFCACAFDSISVRNFFRYLKPGQQSVTTWSKHGSLSGLLLDRCLQRRQRRLPKLLV